MSNLEKGNMAMRTLLISLEEATEVRL